MKYKKIEIINYCEEVKKSKDFSCPKCLIYSVCNDYLCSIPCIDKCEKWLNIDIDIAYDILKKEKGIKHLLDFEFAHLTEDELSQFSYKEILYSLQELSNKIEKLEYKIDKLY